LSAGKIVVDMSSISPIETKAFARRINERGCEYKPKTTTAAGLGWIKPYFGS